MPYFATEQLIGLIETDWDLVGMVHFTQEGKGAGGGWRHVRVCVSVCVCCGLRGSTNETMFSQQKEGVRERIGRAQSFDFTLEI